MITLKSLITARFLVQPGPSLLWRVTPYALPILQENGIPFNTKGEFTPPDEWRTARNLVNYDAFIAENKDQFATLMTRLIEKAPSTLEKCTLRMTHGEYALLLGFAGQEVYDFFVFDHRFGPPPRGKMYRSNIRGAWVEKVGGRKISRPDNALLALRRSIDHYTAKGADVTELVAEYRRREEAMAAGRSWKEGQVGIVSGGGIKRFDRERKKPGRKPLGHRPWDRPASGVVTSVVRGAETDTVTGPAEGTRDDS